MLVGTVRVVTTGRGEGGRIFTELGAAEYRYELSINKLVGDEQSAARTSYRLPITMSDAVRARAEHLLLAGHSAAPLAGMVQRVTDVPLLIHDPDGRLRDQAEPISRLTAQPDALNQAHRLQL